MNKRTLFVGQIPNAFGYGLMVAEDSEQSCIKALKNSYDKWKRIYNFKKSFKEAFEYFGGSIQEIELGKVYYDGFGG
jgi:hypothetical protein